MSRGSSAPAAARAAATSVIGLSLVLLVSVPVRAQGPAVPPAVPPATSAASFADTTRPVMFLKEVVTTGSRYPRAYYESPQALSFVTRAQLREQTPAVVGDVLSQLPGVDNSKDSPWEQRPVLRGLGGQRVLVLMDGSPVNSARGNGPHPSLVEPDQVERIEVVRGPSSVAYGSDALGGAINIITRDAGPGTGDGFRGSVLLGGSSADHQQYGSVQLMPRVGKLSAFISGGARKALNYKLPDGIRVDDSGFKDYNGLANLRYGLTDHMALKAGYQLYRGTWIGLPGLTAEIVDPVGQPLFFQEFRFPDYDRDAAYLTLEHQYPDSWFAKSHAKVYWQREHRNFFSHEEFSTALFPPGTPIPTGARTRITNQDRFFDLDTWGLQTQFTSRKTRRYLLSSGLDLASDRTDGDNVRQRYWVDAYGTPVQPQDPDRITASVPDGTFGNYAAFAQSEVYLGTQWTASAGGRYTRYRYRTEYGLQSPGVYYQPLTVDDGSLSGSLGVVYTPVKDLHLTANIANGYRQPNAQDLFFNGPASVGTVLGNPALTPERSVSYDLGLRWGPGSLAVAGNLFYSTYRDLIDAINVTPPGTPPGVPPTYQYVNISDARIWGGEFEGEVRFLRQWQARLSMAGAIGDITNADAILMLYGVTQDQAPLPNVPPFKGVTSVRWTGMSGRLWVEPAMRWSWRTNRLAIATPGLPSQFRKEWLVGDVLAGFRLPRGQRIGLGVRNVANRNYTMPLASIPESARSWTADLTVDF